MSNKKFNNLIEQCHGNIQKAWDVAILLPKYRQYWMFKNNILFLSKKESTDTIPFDKDVANWLLFALRTSPTYETSFSLDCPFFVRDYHRILAPGEKNKSIIQCTGRNIYQAIIPRIKPGFYVYFNGELLLHRESQNELRANIEDAIVSLCNFFPVRLEYTTDLPFNEFSLVGDLLSASGLGNPSYTFKIADLQRAELIKNLGYKISWEFSYMAQMLRMKYGRGFVYIPAIETSHIPSIKI